LYGAYTSLNLQTKHFIEKYGLNDRLFNRSQLGKRQNENSNIGQFDAKRQNQGSAANYGQQV